MESDFDTDLEQSLSIVITEHEARLKERQASAYEQLRDFSKSFETTIVTLSAGSIAGSVSFIERLPVSGRPYIVAGWIFLALSLLSVLLAYQLLIVLLRREYSRTFAQEPLLRRVKIAMATKNLAEIKEIAKSDVVDGRPAGQTVIERFSLCLDWAAIAFLMGGVTCLLMAIMHLK